MKKPQLDKPPLTLTFNWSGDIPKKAIKVLKRMCKPTTVTLNLLKKKGSK